MNDVYTVDFTRALPPTLANDPKMLPLAQTIAAPLQENIKLARLTLIFHRIDELEEDVLDILARDMHVDWWDDSYPTTIKRRILKDSVRVHMRLGTKFAVQTALRNVFPHSEVEAWYEYGSTHHRFRIILDLRESLVAADLTRLRRVLPLFNRLTVHLDVIILRFLVDKTPIIKVGAIEHAIAHLTHPADRAITQEHTSPAIPIISAVFAKHAIKHIVTPQKRDFTKDHNTATAYLINTGFVKHIIEHTVTPQKRDVNNTAEVYLISTGLAKHAIKHTVTPQTRDITSMSAISITNTGKTKHAVKHSSIPF